MTIKTTLPETGLSFMLQTQWPAVLIGPLELSAHAGSQTKCRRPSGFPLKSTLHHKS